MTHPEIEDHLARNIENPAWEFVKDIPNDPLLGRFRSGWTPTSYDYSDKTVTPRANRAEFTSRWAWAIPSPETIAFILTTLDGRPVVEIGAGSGYWAWLLAQSGVDINAFDKAPIGHPDSWFSEEHMKERKLDPALKPQEFFPVYPGDAEILTAEDPARVLLLVWPTYDTDFAARAVKSYLGDTIIYVGEGPGGCTGDDEFFTLTGHKDVCGCSWRLEDDEVCIHEEIKPLFEASHDGPLTQWSGLNDYLTVFTRIPT